MIGRGFGQAGGICSQPPYVGSTPVIVNGVTVACQFPGINPGIDPSNPTYGVGTWTNPSPQLLQQLSAATGYTGQGIRPSHFLGPAQDPTSTMGTTTTTQTQTTTGNGTIVANLGPGSAGALQKVLNLTLATADQWNWAFRQLAGYGLDTLYGFNFDTVYGPVPRQPITANAFLAAPASLGYKQMKPATQPSGGTQSTNAQGQTGAPPGTGSGTTGGATATTTNYMPLILAGAAGLLVVMMTMGGHKRGREQ